MVGSESEIPRNHEDTAHKPEEVRQDIITVVLVVAHHALFQNARRPRLTGWAAIQDHMKGHDKDMIKSLDDDINQLPVFVSLYFVAWILLDSSTKAGLFSAVLTAFINESYQLLSPNDTTTSTNLLATISQQLANPNHTLVQPPAPPGPFQPSPSAVWINCLWFLSLILSLASALFGMIAKQWLHEYLEWTNTSSSLEDAVALRQTRYEAFIRWRVRSTIATIPALLEIALILFFGGLVALLWTVDGPVAWVSTVAIAVLLVFASITAILPVFIPSCPYKSRTGRACLWLGWTLGEMWNQGVTTFYMALPYNFPGSQVLPNLLARFHQYYNWRTRDRCSTITKVIISRSTVKALDVAGILIPGESMLHPEERQAVAAKVYYLSHALLWVKRTTQDAHISACELDCRTSMSTGYDTLTYIITLFSLASELLHVDPHTLCGWLDSLYFIEEDESGRLQCAWIDPEWHQTIPSSMHHALSRADSIRAALPQLATYLAQGFERIFKVIKNEPIPIAPATARLVMRVLTLAAASASDSDSETAFKIVSLFLFSHDDDFDCLPGLRISLFDIVRWDAKYLPHELDRK